MKQIETPKLRGAELATHLVSRFKSRQATIGVVGLGYVGLPLCGALVGAGLRTIGFDIDASKIESIEAGHTYIKHLSDGFIAGMRDSGLFSATTDFAAAVKADAIIVCVPTPLTRHRTPDISFIENTFEELAKHARPGQLYVLESTTWPGTTAQVVRPILEQTGLKSGEDLFLAFSPEREDPGNENFSTKTIAKVVGGEGPDALRVATALYDEVVVKTVPVSSTAAAEAAKLTENIFRSVNIALVNELKLVYDAMGIDVWEVIDAAKTKPFGYMAFYPGPGLGGHCIPIDPFYLTWKAHEYGISTRFIELAGEINTRMPHHVVARLAEALDRQAGVSLSRAKVLIIGVAYKKNVDDMRESPSLVLTELLEARGAEVEFYDPLIPVIPPTREHANLTGRRSIEWSEADIAEFDAVLISTDHDAVDYAALVRNSRLIVDTRNACGKRGHVEAKIVKA
jgi:UDP-N-acetyl-D-glucosamine dehydrogenase